MSNSSTTLSKLAGSAIVVFVATMIGRSISLLSEILIVRSLDPVIFGRISLAYTIVSSAGSIILLGIHEGVTRQFSAADSAEDQIQIIHSGYLTGFVSAAIASSIFFVLRHWIADIMDVDQLSTILVYFIPYLLLFPAAKISLSILRGQKKTFAAVVSEHIIGKFVPILLLSAVLVYFDNFFGPIVYWVSVPLTMLLASILYLRNKFKIKNMFVTTPEKSVIIDLWKFSWPLALGSVIFLLLSKLDILMIGYFLNERNVGLYRAIQPLQGAATIALGSFTFLFLPTATEYYVNDNNEGLNRIFKITTKWVLLMTLPFVFVFVLFSQDVVLSFFGDEYISSAPVLSILVGGLIFRAASGLNGDMVKAINRPQIELYSGVVGLISNFILNLLLIPTYGISGAAVATVVGYIIYNTIEVVWIYQITSSVPFSRNMIKYSIVSIVTAVAISEIIKTQLQFIDLVGVGILFVCLQPVLLVITQSVDEGDLVLVERLESKFGLDMSLVKRILKFGT